MPTTQLTERRQERRAVLPKIWNLVHTRVVSPWYHGLGILWHSQVQGAATHWLKTSSHRLAKRCSCFTAKDEAAENVAHSRVIVEPLHSSGPYSGNHTKRIFGVFTAWHHSVLWWPLQTVGYLLVSWDCNSCRGLFSYACVTCTVSATTLRTQYKTQMFHHWLMPCSKHIRNALHVAAA